MKRLALSVAVLALMAGSAFAADYDKYGYVEGGVKLNAEVKTNVHGDYNQNVASGTYARAFQSIGTIHGGTEVEAPLEMNVSASYNQNAAEGEEALACQAIGSIGEFPACREAYHYTPY